MLSDDAIVFLKFIHYLDHVIQSISDMIVHNRLGPLAGVCCVAHHVGLVQDDLVSPQPGPAPGLKFGGV